MEAAFIGILTAAAGVSAIVGTRVYPQSRPQGSLYPSLTCTRISGGPLYDDDGEVGLENARIQVDCWAEDYGAAKDLARAVRGVLSAFEGVAGSVDFRYIMLDDERDLRESGGNVAEYPFRTVLDFNVWTRV